MQPIGNTVIESLGIYLPSNVVTTAEVVQGCKLGLPIPLERLTGIKSRRVASPSESSLDLAREAALSCLARSKYEPPDIELLICCSISKAQSPTECCVEPMMSLRLRQSLGMSNAVTFDITNACAGLFTGIAIADALLKSRAVRCAMVVSGEWASNVITTAQLEIESLVDQRIPCLTVGDAGAAVTLESSPDSRVGFHDIDLYTVGRYSSLCIAKPTDREHGGLIMVTDSIKISLTSVPRAVQHMDWLMKRRGWTFDEIGHVIPHQTSRTTLQDAERQLIELIDPSIDLDGKNVDNLTERGNTATTTHLVALEDAILDGRIRSGEKVVFSVTGSGITIGTALYTFDDLPDRRRRWETRSEKPSQASSDQLDRGVPRVPLNRVRVESIGTVGEGSNANDTLALVREAAGRCFTQSRYRPTDVDLLIFAGLYRTDYIIEPAIASLVAGELGLNDDAAEPTGRKTFAFDLLNGAIGFLNACHVASTMIALGTYRTAMIVAAEVENHARDPSKPRRGIAEAGSAAMLDGSGEGGAGFGRFAFSYYAEHLDALQVTAAQEGGQVCLRIDRHPWLEELYLDCVADAIRRFLIEVDLDLNDVRVVIPPQISPWFAQALAEELSLPRERLVDVSRDGEDLFSSAIPYALDEVRRRDLACSGDVGLIVAVGSGIQVGCALYHF